jgi:RNA polymerase sigma-70 factor (ECF subfamily)
MRRAQGGDRLAYEALLHEVVVLLRAYARRRLGGPSGLDDVVQDTLLALHRDRHTYDPARPFCPWLYAIASHRLLDFARRRRRQAEHEVADEVALAERSDEAVTDPCGRSGLLHQALALLSRKQREIIQLLKLEGFTVAEISRRTGSSEASVKVTAHRGYRNLRKLMEDPAYDD